MRLTDANITNSIKNAVESTTPEVIANVLLRIEDDERGETVVEQTRTTGNIVHISEEIAVKKQERPTKWAKRMASLAAAVAIVFGAFFAYTNLATGATISFDVNPSIELRINSKGKVISATPLNEDAVVVLGDMNLKGTDLNVATNALIGAMVQNGYIDDTQNTILVSVSGTNASNEEALQTQLMGQVNNSLSSYSINGAVISQNVANNDTLKKLAQENNISMGKAALIQSLIERDPTLDFATLSRLSVNDLYLLINAKQVSLTNVQASGQVSNGAYIGESRAKEIALAHANVQEADIFSMEIELDYENGRMVYEIEFCTVTQKFEYEIDSVTGEVVQFKQKTNNKNNYNNTSGLIGIDAAQEIALNNAGVPHGNAYIVKMETYDYQDVMIYDVIFICDNVKYCYKINANTGNVMSCSNYSIHHGGSHHQYGQTNGTGNDGVGNGTTGNGAGTAGNYIGTDAAQNVALNHAGATIDAVYKFDIKLDRENGRMVYEVEFAYNGMEYEYEIDAYTGDIIWWESERD